MAEKQELSPQEQLFLDCLFDGNVIRHPDEAKVMAGYPQDYPWLKIISKCNDALIAKNNDYLTYASTRGVVSLVELLENFQTPGAAIKLKALIELLDRGGVVKKERVETTQNTPNYVFLLPPKQEIKEN